MKGTIELSTPIRIDGAEIKELTYDTDKITIENYISANKKAVAAGGMGITGATPQLDYSFQFYIGVQAIIAENPKYDITDIERVKGGDLMKIQAVGQLFTLGRELPTEEPSDQHLEDIPEPTTLTLLNSDSSL